MNRFVVVTFVISLIQLNGFSQEKINSYKYIVIPMQYEFQKSEDQYQINSLTKFLFNKYGYEAYFQNENYPKDLLTNRCLALTADVVNLKGFLNTKVQIELRDCDNNLIATSQEGKAKEKAYDKAYNLAIRDAFKTFQFFNYQYKEDPAIVSRGVDVSKAETKEIERLKKEVEALKEQVVENKSETVVPNNKEVEDLEVEKEESVTPETPVSTQNGDTTLYAQPIDGGFQVVDTEPKKVMILLHSGASDSFMVKGKDAMVYKKDGVWIYAEHDGKRLITKEIKLKF